MSVAGVGGSPRICSGDRYAGLSRRSRSSAAQTAEIGRDPEVRQVRVPLLVQQDVRGLEVAVDDPETVSEGERARDLLLEPRDGFEVDRRASRCSRRGCRRGTSASRGTRRPARASSRTGGRCSRARAGRRAAPPPRTYG